MLVMVRLVVLLALIVPEGGFIALAAGTSLTEVQEHRGQMLKNAEEMVAHGGMGDAKAIVHHCQELAKHAEGLLRDLRPGDPHGKDAILRLQEAINHCERVAKIGGHADPGQLLNPAIKARAAAREAAKHLAELQESAR